MKNLREAQKHLHFQQNLDRSFNQKLSMFNELDLYEKFRLANKYYYKGAYYSLVDAEKVNIISQIQKENV